MKRPPIHNLRVSAGSEQLGDPHPTTPSGTAKSQKMELHLRALAPLVLFSVLLASVVNIPQALAGPLIRRDDLQDVVGSLAELPAGQDAAEALGDGIKASGTLLAKAQGFTTTRNDFRLGVCSDLMLIFVRGMQEPGNLGALVGPPLIKAMEKQVPAGVSFAVEGVNYQALVADYLKGGGEEGAIKT
jgi:hypothetical protein